MKKLFYFLIGGALLISTLLFILLNLPEQHNTISLEYGELLSFESKFDDYTINTDSIKSIHDYPEVGEYELYAKPHNRLFQRAYLISLHIKDTTAPLIKQKVDPIEIVIDQEFILTDYFETVDLSDVTISSNLYSIDFSKAGEYQSEVIAKDRFNNVSTLKYTIKIISPKTNSKEDPKSNTPSDNIVEETVKTPFNITKPTIINNIIVVNKKNPFPLNYVTQENPEALRHLKSFISDMQSFGFDIDNSYSGYRSYNYQEKLYNNYVKRYGVQEANTFSAKPGYSEHHTGLAFDLKHTNKTLVENADEVKYINDNAHKYGFIVRYKKGKEHITGYIHEPWHIRYVGDIATYLYETDLTLEEYLAIEGGDY